MRIERAVILAAGEGQRLRPFTVLKPKVMIPIANKPILQYVVLYCNMWSRPLLQTVCAI